MSKNLTEIIRVYWSIAIILLFRIDIVLSNESVQFCTELPRTELDDKVELKKVFWPSYLLMDKDLGCRKIL